MNNRIMAALFALTLCLCLFIGVVPVNAEAACTHSNNELVDIPATCETDGVAAHYECKDCREWSSNGWFTNTMNQAAKDALKIKANGHSYVRDNNTWDAENHWEQCSVCGDKRNVEKHNEAKYTNGAATCDAECSVCGYVTKGEHNLVPTNEKCDETNHRTVCTKCGGEGATQTHDWDKVVDEEKHTYTCKICGYVSKDSANHSGMDDDCKCNTCGYQKPHVFDKWDAPATGHRPICSACGMYDESVIWMPHTYEYTYAGLVNGKPAHALACTECGYGKDGDVKNYCYDNGDDCICDDCKNPIPHVWSDTTAGHKHSPEVKPTCENTGKVSFKVCGNCSQYFLPDGTIVSAEAVIVPALGHNYVWDKGDYNTEHYQYCDRLLADGVTMCGHQDNRGNHDFDYSDNGNGTHKLTCKICGYVGDVYCSEVAGDGKCECVCGHAMPHDTANKDYMKRVAYKAPGCVEEGNRKHYECKECGSKFWIQDASQTIYTQATDPADLVIPAIGHKLKGRVVSGMHVTECENGCGLIDELMPHTDLEGDDCVCDILLADGTTKCSTKIHTHHYVKVERQEPTCQTEGFEEYYKVLEDCGRMFTDNTYTQEIDAPVAIAKVACEKGEWENKDEDNHVKKCIYCETVMETAAHVDANGDLACDDCGFVLNLTHVPQQDPTCTNVGYVEYWVSAVGNKYADENGQQKITTVPTIAALGHNLTECTLKGNGHEYSCSRCDYTEFESHNLNGCFCVDCLGVVNGHELMEPVLYKAPTCEDSGNRAYIKCSCGKYYNMALELTTKQALTLAPTGHSWGSDVKNNTSGDNHYNVCAECDERQYMEHEDTVKDPLKGNYHQYVCACGDIEIEQHYDNNGDNKCDKCKHDMSGKTVQVTQHDQTTVTAGNPETVKPYEHWLKNFFENLFPSNSGAAPAATPAATPAAEEPETPRTPAPQAPEADETPETPEQNQEREPVNTPTETAPSSANTGIINQFIQILSNFFAALFG